MNLVNTRVRVFSKWNQNKNMGHQYAMEVCLRKFEETRNVCKKKTAVERIDLSCQIEILVAMNPPLSIPEVSKLTNIYIDYAHKTLIKNKIIHSKCEFFMKSAKQIMIE